MKPHLNIQAWNRRKFHAKDYFEDGKKGISLSTFYRILRGESATIWAIHKALDLLQIPDSNRDQYIDWR